MRSHAPIFVIAILALFLGATFLIPNALRAPPATVATLHSGLASWELSNISTQIGGSDTTYHITDASGTYSAVSPTNHYQVAFSSEGPTFTYASSSFTLGLAGARYDTPTVANNTITYNRGAFREWYSNGPLGMEQGFTFPSNPRPGEPLSLTFALGNIASASAHDDGQGVTLTTTDGKTLEYQGLTAYDANHKLLPAEFAYTSAGTIIVSVDDTGAVYPVTIDPYVQEQKITASDGVGNDYFGYTTTMSSDGSRVAMGAIGVSSSRGAVYVFSRSGTVWTQEQKLQASDGGASDYFGVSLSMSGDGTRLAIGAYGGPSGAFQGATYIFSRSGTVWTQEQKLTASDGQGADYFGNSMAMTNDGSRVAIGAYGVAANAFKGAVYIFSRSGTVWTQEQKVTASDGQSSDYFGRSLAIASDGSRIAVGAYGSPAGAFQGAVYVFSRSGTVWTQEQKISASDGQGSDNFAVSMAMSGDATRIAVGAYGVSAGAFRGAVYTYTRSGTVWTQEQKLTASDGGASDYFGASVALSTDASRMAVGAYNSPGGGAQGSMYTFTRSGSTWTQEQKLTASDKANGDRLAISIAMSGDGSRVAGGAYGSPGGGFVGAGYIYNLPTTTSGFNVRLLRVPVPPRISVTASTSRGLVTYTYAVTNPTVYTGADPIANVTVSDKLCSSVVFSGGDDNKNLALDRSETWTYRCTAALATAVQSIANLSWYMNYGLSLLSVITPASASH